MVALLVLGVVVAPSLVTALTAPGADSVAARLAEWGRDHGLGSTVTWLEARQYDLAPPPVGGVPAGGIPRVPVSAGPVSPARSAVPVRGLPEPASLPVHPGVSRLPEEGLWQPVVSTPAGDAVRVAYVRPDATHTSVIVGVMWLDPTLVTGRLHPGTQDPGGSWSTPTSVTPTLQRTVAAVFSAGFRLADSDGGWYADGREARPLVPGAASLVLRRDGTADVGAWGTEVRMGPEVASVRQNLVPLVDGGRVNPTCATGGTAEWGSTVGQAAYIHRSGFGVTAQGAEVYVGGPSLSVCSLGEILRSAGVVRGMELDINPAWVSGAYFRPRPQGLPQATKLFPDEEIGAEHYLQRSSRDFFAWYLRSDQPTGTAAGGPPQAGRGGSSAPPTPKPDR
ncbi:hypothetical protein [Actinomycetospora sp.]|uniref:hypothetical protein n=1 Tax=Actinomycetospora sp. TaxID=1872135 RepID=UPI002F3F3CF9